MNSHCEIVVENREVTQKLAYRRNPMLTCTIDYPVFKSPDLRRALSRINRYYESQAAAFLRYCQKDLFPAAVKQYKYAQSKGYPFFPYEGLFTHKVTSNEDCLLSLYMDHYEYTGGAHGTTIRSSDTWDFATGQRCSLEDFLPYDKETLFRKINDKIEWQLKSDQMMYFDDYPSLVAKTFNPENFYLTPDEVVIFFQQYDIAPYASGMPEFYFARMSR